MGWELSSAIIQHMFLKSPQRCTIIMFSFHITGCRSLLFIMLVLYVLFTAQCIITCHDLNAHWCAFSQGNMPPTSTYIKSHNLRLFIWLLHTSFDTLRLTYLTSCLIYVPLSPSHTFAAFFFPSFSFSLHWVSIQNSSPLSFAYDSSTSHYQFSPVWLHLSPSCCMTIQ